MLPHELLGQYPGIMWLLSADSGWLPNTVQNYMCVCGGGELSY